MSRYDGSSKIEANADRYLKKYRDQFEAYSKDSVLAKINASIGASEIYALGCQLEQFEDYRRYNESTGTVADLGTIPVIGLDVITASLGQSILPLISSTQDIDTEQGIIYFKQVQATTNGYGRVAGEIMSSATEAGSFSSSYGNYEVQDEIIARTSTGVLSYEFNLPKSPVRPSTIEFKVQETTFRVIDDGRGTLMGNGMFGSVNYDTGVVNLQFATDPGTHNISANYTINVESENSDVVGISGTLTSTSIRAEVFALKSEAGLLHNYSLSKRFGKIADEESAKDLTSELIRTINTAAIKKLDYACTNQVTWNKSAPAGVSYADHKRTFVDAFARAEGALSTAAGRGIISRMIAGTNAAAVLRGIEGFVTVDSSLNQTVGLYGYLNGIPVIRAGTNIDTDSILCCYKGGSYFESPLVNTVH